MIIVDGHGRPISAADVMQHAYAALQQAADGQSPEVITAVTYRASVLVELAKLMASA
jgi:TPP-dependent pyruvate/acetoin dehydrogenase alpha subunit